jgi:hypothetical protein
MTKNVKNLQLKKPPTFSTNAIYFSLGLHVQASGEALTLKREQPALQNMKFLPFFYFALLDPDPHSRCRSGRTDQNPMRIWIHNTDLDTGGKCRKKYCFYLF